jgi:hypothetical protein
MAGPELECDTHGEIALEFTGVSIEYLSLGFTHTLVSEGFDMDIIRPPEQNEFRRRTCRGEDGGDVFARMDIPAGTPLDRAPVIAVVPVRSLSLTVRQTTSTSVRTPPRRQARLIAQ